MKHQSYTLVQHSGARHDPGFAQAVEEAVLTSQAELERVRRVGGLVFAHYDLASKAEYAENYPPEVQGLYPRARGTFSRELVGGRRIYIPKLESPCHVDL